MSQIGPEIVLGVGGGIAAYKSCELLRRLQDRGYQVTVVQIGRASCRERV